MSKRRIGCWFLGATWCMCVRARVRVGGNQDVRKPETAPVLERMRLRAVDRGQQEDAGAGEADAFEQAREPRGVPQALEAHGAASAPQASSRPPSSRCASDAGVCRVRRAATSRRATDVRRQEPQFSTRRGNMSSSARPGAHVGLASGAPRPASLPIGAAASLSCRPRGVERSSSAYFDCVRPGTLRGLPGDPGEPCKSSDAVQ